MLVSLTNANKTSFGVICWGNSETFFQGNAFADALAGQATEINSVDPDTVSSIQFICARTAEIRSRLIAVMTRSFDQM